MAFGLLVASIAAGQPAGVQADEPTRFKRIATQFIAALGDPDASSGNGAGGWGLWRRDPGPHGVWLDNFDELKSRGVVVAPADWKFDSTDWWLDENGLIMENPDFPVPPGKYVVTGDREAVTVLTIHPPDDNGDRRWELAAGTTLYDVTHLPCRSARYTPASSGEACTPANAPKTEFPVKPGGRMPSVEGCAKQQYAVLFVIGVPAEN